MDATLKTKCKKTYKHRHNTRKKETACFAFDQRPVGNTTPPINAREEVNEEINERTIRMSESENETKSGEDGIRQQTLMTDEQSQRYRIKRN
jgi:hypothetical protein